MVYWASVLAALGWMYAAMASLWPMLFQRDVVKTGLREELGYRIGLWKVYWRLPTRAAIVVVLLSMVPILTVIFFDGWLVTVILATITGITLILWMIAPPGMIIGSVMKGLEDGHPVLEAQSRRNGLRSILVLAIFGLIPAFGIGAVLNWILSGPSISNVMAKAGASPS